MIEATDLSWSYGANQVLNAVDLATKPNRVLGLIGPNGSGKTTLLRLLYGVLHSPTGAVQVDGRNRDELAPRELAERLAVVVQESGGESSITVAEMVLLGRVPHRSSFGRTTEEDRRIAAEALRQVGATHLAGRPFVQVSGGERQRVLIARALAQRATHLLLDEPTNHLDIRYQHEVLGLVARLARELGTATVVVLHDLNLAARYCDDLVLLGAGGVVRSGSVAHVLDPEVLEPVYGIGVERVERDSDLHLLFHPLHTTPAGQSAPSEESA